MNGRMLSRAIHRTSPATMAADDEDRDARRERGEPPFAGAGRRVDERRRRKARHPSRQRVEGPSATEGAGSSMVPQTTRRGTRRPRDQARRRAAGGSASGSREPGQGRPLPDSAGGSSSPATRRRPSSPVASWATRGTRRSRRPGCRSIDRSGRNRGPRSHSGRQSRRAWRSRASWPTSSSPRCCPPGPCASR